MVCYQLTFHDAQTFEVVIESAPVHGDDHENVCIALIYGLANGVREAEPLHRVGGGPIQVLAVNEQTALDIVTEVLKEVTGSRPAAIAQGSPSPFSPPVPRMA